MFRASTASPMGSRISLSESPCRPPARSRLHGSFRVSRWLAFEDMTPNVTASYTSRHTLPTWRGSRIPFAAWPATTLLRDRTRLTARVPHLGRAPAGRHGPPGDPLGHRRDAPQGTPGDVVRRGAARTGRRHGRHDVRRRRGRARRLPDRGRPGGVRLRLPRRRRHHPPGVVCNPVVELPEGKDRKLDDCEEGCLSYPGAFVDCARPDRAKVFGQGLDGEDVTYEGGGLFARCLQHETDHTVGTVFGDRLNNRARKKLRKQMEDAAEDYPRTVAGRRHSDVRRRSSARPVRGAPIPEPRATRALSRRRRLQARRATAAPPSRSCRPRPRSRSRRCLLLAHQLAHAGESEPGAAVVLGHPAADELVEDHADVVGVDARGPVASPYRAGIPPVARLKSMCTSESGAEYFSALTTRLVTTRCIATPLARGEGDVVGDLDPPGVEVGGQVLRPHCERPGPGRCRPARGGLSGALGGELALVPRPCRAVGRRWTPPCRSGAVARRRPRRRGSRRRSP